MYRKRYRPDDGGFQVAAVIGIVVVLWFVLNAICPMRTGAGQ